MTLIKILIELFGHVIDKTLTLDERLASVFQEVLTLPFSNAEQTLLMMFSFFGYHESLAALPKLLSDTIPSSSWMLYVNDGSLLTQIGIVSPMFEKKIVRERTTIFYRQRRHNLLREETEGYSKLLVELSNTIALAKNCTEESGVKLAGQTASNIVSLIGYFDLDPIRTLDIFLNVFILDILYTSEVMMQVLAQTPFWEEGVPNYEAAQLLGVKLVAANSAQHKKEAENTSAAVALLIQMGFIKFEAIYPFLEPLEAQVTAQKDLYYEELRNKPSVSGMASLGNALAMAQFDGEEGDDAGEEEQAVTLAPTIHTHLLQALLSRGIMEHSFFILSKFSWLPGAFPLVSRLIYRLFEAGLAPLYDEHRPFEVVSELSHVKKVPCQADETLLTLPRGHSNQPTIYPFDDVGSETRYFDAAESWKEAVEEINNKEDLFEQSKKILGLTGPHLCYNLRLFAKLCRIASACQSEDPSWWYDFLRLYILPSVALISNNPLALAEVFKVVKQFPADMRFRLYGEWSSGILKSCPELRIATLNTEKETKRVLKRLSKQNVREMMRKLAKISYANPLPTFTAFVSQVESYDNLSDLVVEAAKYFTDLGWDALPFVIILQLTSSGRDTVQRDGLNDRKWLQSLAHFTGRLCSRYSVMMDCWPIFDLLIKQLHLQDSSMLVVLREILSSMTGVAQQQNISPEQALSLGFSPHLKNAVFKVIGDTRMDKEKPAARLFNTLGGQRALELFILLCQTQQQLVFVPGNMHQKVLALRHDEVTGVLNQYIEAITWFVKPLDKFETTFVSVVDLVTKYGVSPAYAFALWRPMLSQLVKSDSTVLAKLKEGLPAPEHISSSLYVTFWQLSLYDIHYDHSVYSAELARLDKAKKPSSSLTDEDKTHTLHTMKTKIRLSAEKDSYFPCPGDAASDEAKVLRKQQFSELLASCVLPRAVLSAVDALYSAHFVITLHQLGTPNFSTLGVLDQIFNSALLIPTLYTCTAGETENLGLFYHEILSVLNAWRAKPEEYEKDGLGGTVGRTGESATTYRFPGFRLSYGLGNNKVESMLSHDMLRTVVEKWHRKIHATIAECLSRDDYMSRRNAIIFLRSVVGQFPLVAGHGVDVSKRLDLISKEESREDIKLAALSLLGHVTRTEGQWIEIYDFKPMSEADQKVEMEKAEKRVQARKKAGEVARERAERDVREREKTRDREEKPREERARESRDSDRRDDRSSRDKDSKRDDKRERDRDEPRSSRDSESRVSSSRSSRATSPRREREREREQRNKERERMRERDPRDSRDGRESRDDRSSRNKHRRGKDEPASLPSKPALPAKPPLRPRGDERGAGRDVRDQLSRDMQAAARDSRDGRDSRDSRDSGREPRESQSSARDAAAASSREGASRDSASTSGPSRDRRFGDSENLSIESRMNRRAGGDPESVPPPPPPPSGPRSSRDRERESRAREREAASSSAAPPSRPARDRERSDRDQRKDREDRDRRRGGEDPHRIQIGRPRASGGSRDGPSGSRDGGSRDSGNGGSAGSGSTESTSASRDSDSSRNWNREPPREPRRGNGDRFSSRKHSSSSQDDSRGEKRRRTGR